MSNKKPLLSVKSDFIFKLIFGDQRNVDILAEFLKPILRIPDEEYEKLTIIDPYVKKEAEDDKYGILDVKVHTKNGQIIHVEIQVNPIPEMRERCVYYQSKMVTEQMSSGDDFSKIKRVITIVITDYPMINESQKYHNQFRYRTEDGIEFTDLKEINTLELSKLPQSTDSSELWNWLKFINSDDEEVLDMLAERSPQMKKAVGLLKELSADERTRMLAEDREKARRDMVSRMNGAKREGVLGVARNAIGMGMDIDTIIKLTGLPHDEIERLQQ